jgi:DNA-binding SARP family transcriptional activator/tetratricopeptide (TPR) repeat protein/DNA-binding CsgD family transcriptional regulator
MQFGILGPLLVDDGTQVVPIRAARRRVLLAALLLRTNTVVSADELAEVLWDGRPPRGARGALHNHVMRLRQALGTTAGSRLRTQSPGYVIDVGDDELDLHRFASLRDAGRAFARVRDWEQTARVMRTALTLQRGQPLLDVPSELLQRNEGSRLVEMWVQTLEWRIDADLHLERHEELVSELRQLVRDHPLRERFHAQLMLSLYHSNRQAEALEVFHAVRRHLVEELGVEPGVDLQQAHRQILTAGPAAPEHRADQASAAPASPNTAGPNTAGPTSASPTTAGPTSVSPAPARPNAGWPCDAYPKTPLIGREKDVETLAALAAAARAGHAGLALVHGPTGIGKTSLLDTWTGQERQRGMRIIRATCAESESALAFAVVRQLFEPVIASAPEQTRAMLFDAQATLAKRALAVDMDPSGDDTALATSFAVLHSLYWLLVNLTTTGPLAIVIDDVQWSDPPSLRWLAYMGRRLEGLPVLLVISARTDNDKHLDSDLLTELASRRDCHLLHLGALTEANAFQLVTAVLGPETDAEFCAACLETSEGNPLVLLELLQTIAASGLPPLAKNTDQVREFGVETLTRGVLDRLAGQPEQTIRVATALAILGDGAPERITAELACLIEFDVTEQIRRLKRLGVLNDSSSIRFRHPLVRVAIANSVMTSVERATAHATAARLLYDDGASSEMVASHLMLTEFIGDGWPVEVLMDAARTTRNRGATQVSLAYLKRALREPLTVSDRARVLSTLGADEVNHNPPAAVRHLREGLYFMTDPAERAKATGTLAAALLISHRGQEAVTVLEEAISEVRRTQQHESGQLREVWLTLEAQLIQIAYASVSTISVVRDRIGALEQLTLPGDTSGERALLAALALHGLAGHATAAQTGSLAGRALRGGLRCNGTTNVLFSLAINSFIATDRLDEASGWYREIAEQAKRDGSPRLFALSRFGASSIASRRGAVAEALAQAQAALEVAPAELGPGWLPVIALIVDAHIDLGNLEAAERVLRDYQITDAPDALWDRGAFLLARGRLRLATGDPTGALAAFLECGSHQDAAGIVNPTVTPWRSQAALAYAATGQYSAAVELAAEELALSRRWGTPRAIGVSLHCFSLVTGRDEALALLHHAVTTLEQSPARLELARALFDLGITQRRSGHEAGEAGATLRRALDLAELCGAQALICQIRTALGVGAQQPAPKPLQAGRSSTAATPDDETLTVDERQVTAMAVHGLTGPEIAEALFVSLGTVQSQLASACRKLELTDRRQLSDVLTHQGQGPRPSPNSVRRPTRQPGPLRMPLVLPT